jgi:hypothetical protein
MIFLNNNRNICSSSSLAASSEHARGSGRSGAYRRPGVQAAAALSLSPRQRPNGRSTHRQRDGACRCRPSSPERPNVPRPRPTLTLRLRATSDEMPGTGADSPDPRQANLATQPPVVGTPARRIGCSGSDEDDPPARVGTWLPFLWKKKTPAVTLAWLGRSVTARIAAGTVSSYLLHFC